MALPLGAISNLQEVCIDLFSTPLFCEIAPPSSPIVRTITRDRYFKRT